MRRPLMLAAFVTLFTLALASAQRGGMRASGGGSGRGVSGHSFSGGHSSGGRGFSGMRAGFGSRAGIRSGSFGGVRIRNRDFHRCIGCRSRFGYPWYPGYYAGYYPGYYPYDWWDSSSSYDGDQERELALASEMDSVNAEQQRLREEEGRDRDQDSYVRRARPRIEARGGEERTVSGPSTALVFRDKHVEEIRNYAIAGGTLWVLNEQAAKKIPLAQLDLAATARMNDDRGVDFQLPK